MVEILAMQEMRRLGMLNPYAEPFYSNGTTFYDQEPILKHKVWSNEAHERHDQETSENTKITKNNIKEHKQYNGQFTNIWVSKGRVFDKKNNEYMSKDKNVHQKLRNNEKQVGNYYAILNEDDKMEYECGTAYKIAVDIKSQEIEEEKQQMNEKMELIMEEYDIEKVSNDTLGRMIKLYDQYDGKMKQ